MNEPPVRLAFIDLAHEFLAGEAQDVEEAATALTRLVVALVGQGEHDADRAGEQLDVACLYEQRPDGTSAWVFQVAGIASEIIYGSLRLGFPEPTRALAPQGMAVLALALRVGLNGPQRCARADLREFGRLFGALRCAGCGERLEGARAIDGHRCPH